jgi:hypothetical protein
MNKTLKYALGVVLTAGLIVPALAQDNFPDVPDHHWAYEALARMRREGLLVGYPDGLFRGGRPATRYEMAVAIHATYSHLKNITDQLDRRIAALEGQPGQTGVVTRQEFDALSQAVQALRADVDRMRGWGDDITALRRMADEFQRELAQMGVDVNQMRQDLSDLASRVGALERRQLPITVSGDVNVFATAAFRQGGNFGITTDARPVGVNLQTLATRDFSVFHEGALRVAGANETGPQWRATLVVGNMLGANTGARGAGTAGVSNSQSTTASGSVFGEQNMTAYFQELAVTFDTSVVGQGFNAEIGRTGYSISPYLYQRPDVTPYYQNERWDNGKWTFDGAILGFRFGGARFNIFGGRNAGVNFAGGGTGMGNQLQPMTAGRTAATQNAFIGSGQRPRGLMMGDIHVDHHVGAHLSVPVTEAGQIDLAYIILADESRSSGGPGGPAANPNRVHVWGGDLAWNFGGIALRAGYAQSDVKSGRTSIVNRDNSAWHASLGFERERWGARVGYREIQPLFAAPGDWGRIGIWWNPVDIRGIDANVHFSLTEALKVNATGNFYTGTGRRVGGATTPGLRTDDRINRVAVDLGYRLNPNWDLTLGFEGVEWRFQGDNRRPRELWYNLGLGYNLSEAARLNFLWQYSDYRSNGRPGFTPFAGNTNEQARGHLVTTQLSVRF